MRAGDDGISYDVEHYPVSIRAGSHESRRHDAARVEVDADRFNPRRLP